jgi:peptidoglycan/xylan/chitin deacetylase (PgdA/CDA1 family)
MSDLKAAVRPAVRQLRRWIPRQTGPAILMYHRIAEESFDPWGMAVSPKHFAEQAEWLTRNRQVLPLVEFASAHREGRLPRRAIAITFDDGYACACKVAAPLLEALKLPATVFLPAAPLERGGEFWWDELERLVLGYRGSSLEIDGRNIELGSRDASDRNWKPYHAPRTRRQKAFKAIWSRIRRKGANEVETAMADLRWQVDAAPAVRESHRIATVDEVRSSKLEPGSHGLSHASLPWLSATDKAREIDGGKAFLGELVGRAPAVFAFPFGDMDRKSEQAVEESGFVCACSSQQKFVRPHSDMFALPRLVVENTGAPGFARMLSGR